jgi:lipoyl(octanoyl) transferase
MHKVREALMRHLSDQFGYHETHPYTGHPLLKRTRRKVMQHA